MDEYWLPEINKITHAGYFIYFFYVTVVFNIWSYLQDKYPSTVTLMGVLSNSPTVNFKRREQGILMSEHTKCDRALTRCCPPLTVSGNGTPWQSSDSGSYSLREVKRGGGISRVTCSAFTGVAGCGSAECGSVKRLDGNQFWWFERLTRTNQSHAPRHRQGRS